MRPLAALVVLASLVLAGCVSSDPTVEPGAADPADLIPDVLSRVSEVVSVIDPEGGMGEPSLGVTPDGAFWTNGRDHEAAHRFTDGGSVYRSADGVTWERVAAPLSPIPNMDPDLAVDRDGTIWYDILYLGCNAVASSRDGGETWTTNPAVCNGPVGDRQYVIPTEGGTAYLYYHQIPTFYQTAMKTTDYGATWSPTGPVEQPDHHLLVDEGTGWGGGGFWNAAQDSVWFTWTWFTQTGGYPGYAVTRDGGATWETGIATETAWGEPLGLGLVVGAADEAGNTYLAWAEANGDETAVFLAVSTDNGESWREPLRVDAAEGSKVFPAIAAGPGGKVAVAWYEADEAGHPYEVSDEARWNVTLAWTSDALAEEPGWSYGRLNEDVVRVGKICPNGTSCRGDRQFLDYFSLEATPDGRVAGVWTNTEAVEGKTVNEFGVTRDAVLG